MLCCKNPGAADLHSRFWTFWGHWADTPADTYRDTPTETPAVHMITVT